ncbi:enoyl-CoA-hydratase DpgB [Kitasatospora sp. McL0602]|uniref:enoyl-CoA-hydratase DpgB n=1 Tax=Kitasatospora sp. McL0602 TaxID=3439530 RepID=UPI003F887EB7
MTPSTTTEAAALVARIDGSKPLSAEIVALVNALCEQAEDSDGTAVAVLHVSGAPAEGWSAGLPVPLVNKWERALRRLERLDTATVAVATGEVGGTAFELLLATDHRIATGGTSFTLPADDSGVWPGMSVYRLANQVGIAGARRAVLFGAPIPALRALELGLVDELVEEAGQAKAVEAVAASAGRWTGMRRQLMLDAATTSFETALGSHLAACDRVLRREPAEAHS